MKRTILMVIFVFAIGLILKACGTSNNNNNDSSIFTDTPELPEAINCPDYPEPTSGLYAWAYGFDSWVLVVEQNPCDGFDGYELWAIFREYNYSNGYYNETYSWSLGKGGCYEMRLAIWHNMSQPCADELWCNNSNACIEFRAINSVTRDVIYRAYAVPGIVNPEYVY